jgi:muramidase (phage lysozyme)/ribosomal protein L21E
MAYGTVTITGATYADSTVSGVTFRTVTYTASNTFTAGDGVTVTGITPTTLNLPTTIGHQVASATSTNFTVIVTVGDVSGSYSSGGSATNFYYTAGDKTNANTFSITEGLPDAIGLPATVNSTYANTQNVYDIAVGGEPFFIAASNTYPYRRETASYKRTQLDTTQAPGEQTFEGWWLRSQNSFHLGTGIKFLEPLQGQDVVYRFNKSSGVDPWTPGQLSLLPDTTSITGTTAVNNMVGGTDSAGVDVVIVADGSTLKRITAAGAITTITYGGSGTILSLTSDGVNYYAATATGIYMGTLAGVATTTAIFTYSTATNVTIAWVKQRLIAAVDNKVYQVVPVAQYTVYGAQLLNKIVTMSTTTAHNFRVNDPIEVIGVDTTDYNSASGIGWIVDSVIDSKTFTYTHATHSADVQYNTAGHTGMSTGGYVKLLNNNTNPIYVHPTSTWKFTSIVEGPTAIYVSGYSGITSTIIKLTLDSSGAVPSLTSATSAADFPDDEYVTSLGSYLGKFVTIGTNKGIRIGVIDSSVYGQGYIAYGPLTYTKPAGTNLVSNFAFYDRFAYATVTNDIDGKSGLLRIDLSQQLSDGKFAWTYDLNSGAAGTCRAVALVGGTGRMAFAVNGSNLYFQHATNKVASGYIDTGAIRYNTLENKHFKLVKPRMLTPVDGSVGISTIDKSGAVNGVITVDGSFDIDQDFATNVNSPADQLAFRFTLNRSGADSTLGPTLTGYQVKALPANRRTRSIEIPLLNYDFESDRYNITTGYEGRAWERLQRVEDIESAGDTVTIQDFTSGEQVVALIEKISFVRMSAPDRRFKGYGGIVYVQVRTV